MDDPTEPRPSGEPPPNPSPSGSAVRDWVTARARDIIRLHQPPRPSTPPPPPVPPVPPVLQGTRPPGNAQPERGQPNQTTPTHEPRSTDRGSDPAADFNQAIERAHDWWGRHHADIFGVPFRRQTYLNIAYLLLQFPLGLAYFVFLVIGLVLGVALVPILVGFPILFMMLLAAAALGKRERRLAHRFLGLDIPAPIEPGGDEQSYFRRLIARLRDQVTWTILLYLVLKLPVGIISFGLTLSLISWTFFEAIGLGGTLGGPAQWAGWQPQPPVFIIRAIIYGYISLHIINGLAYLSGRMARHMLGPSETAMLLAATEQVAVTERAKAEQADQSRRELIVNVSHELRTPTASIRGHVESLLISLDRGKGQPDAVEPGQLHNYLNIIHRETERLSTLVDDLLTLARSESDELRLVVQPAKAQDVVAEVHETLAPLAWRQRSITLVQDIQPNPPLVWADRQRLLQVLHNLVRNAITHTPAGGIVSIGLGPAGPHYVALIVADTGSGIPPEEIDHIFERFYRVDASRTRSSGGFGLGLAIVKELVTAMGGSVAVSSKVGEGSAFRVLLRVAETGATGPATAPTTSRAPAPPTPKKGQTAPIG